MAIYPCDFGAHRYPGPQQTVYVGMVNGGYVSRRKLRLCPKHFRELVDTATLRAHSAQGEFTDEQLVSCYLCGDDVVDSEWQLYLTVYEKGSERTDFWAVMHTDCTPRVAEDFRLDAGIA
jgi:hypothetical protein